MKKFIWLFLFLILFSNLACAEVSITERAQIKEQVNQIISYANSNNYDAISDVISLNSRPGLKEEIELQLAEKNIQYRNVLIGSYKELKNNQIKASGSYSVKNPNWESSGSLMYFTFEKVGDKYLLVDTNFHQIIFPSYILKKIGSIFLIILPILLFLSVFWIWIIVDCSKRDFASRPDDKTLWILLIIFTGIIGAVIYFFVIKIKK